MIDPLGRGTYNGRSIFVGHEPRTPESGHFAAHPGGKPYFIQGKMATTKEKSHHSPAVLANYDRLIAAIPGLERKGATMPYTSHNGNMFSLLNPDGTLSLRLPAAELTRFLAKYKTRLHEAYGIVQKEYADVPQRLFDSPKELIPYFKKSYEYVQSLPAKATTKPKNKPAASLGAKAKKK